MFRRLKLLWQYRELLVILAWKELSVRYKQAYLSVAWVVIKPVLLMLIFTLVRGFVGIDSGDVPYPVLTFAALMPWVLFQESVSTGVISVVSNAPLVRKIYFPREVFPITAVMTKLVELSINCLILALLMLWYDMGLTIQALWAPVFILYSMVIALAVCLLGAGMNVYHRDVTNILPVAISLLMYGSPIIYPMALVKKTLLENQAAGSLSDWIYMLYCLNPLAGIIDGFQKAMLAGQPPDFGVILPGLVLTCVLLPLSSLYFRRAEQHFADVI